MCSHSSAAMYAVINEGGCPACLIAENHSLLEEIQSLRTRLDRMYDEREQLVAGLRVQIDKLAIELERREERKQTVILIPREMFDV